MSAAVEEQIDETEIIDEEVNEPITIVETKTATKTKGEKESDVDPFKLRIRLNSMQDRELINKKYDFFDMTDKEIITVNDEIIRDTKIASRVTRAKVGMIVTWTIIDAVLKLMGLKFISFTDLQMKNMKIYTRALYHHYAEQVDNEKEVEVQQQAPLDRIMDISLKIAIVTVILNIVANKLGGQAATLVKPIAMKMVSSLDEDPTDDPNITLKNSEGLLSAVTEFSDMVGTEDLNLQEAEVVVEEPPHII